MNNRKINIIVLLVWAIVISILFYTCTPVKNNCGTKKQHKTRFNNTKKMAPSMMN